MASGRKKKKMSKKINKKNADLLKSYSRLLSGNCSTSDEKKIKMGRGMKTDQAVSAHGHAIIKQPHADVSLH